MSGMTQEEAIRFVLANPGQKYDLAFLEWAFLPAGMGILDNFGISFRLECENDNNGM